MLHFCCLFIVLNCSPQLIISSLPEIWLTVGYSDQTFLQVLSYFVKTLRVIETGRSSVVLLWLLTIHLCELSLLINLTQSIAADTRFVVHFLCHFSISLYCFCNLLRPAKPINFLMCLSQWFFSLQVLLELGNFLELNVVVGSLLIEIFNWRFLAVTDRTDFRLLGRHYLRVNVSSLALDFPYHFNFPFLLSRPVPYYLFPRLINKY